MEIVIGIFTATAIAVAGRLSGMDRDRAAYPLILVVIASYYVLFALMAGSGQSVWVQLGIALFFSVFAFVGFRWSLWVVVAAMAAHGLLDLVHPLFFADSGAPPWWPGFCLGVDVVLAAGLGWMLMTTRLKTRPPE